MVLRKRQTLYAYLVLATLDYLKCKLVASNKDEAEPQLVKEGGPNERVTYGVCETRVGLNLVSERGFQSTCRASKDESTGGKSKTRSRIETDV
jgi:hypothetical protein